ncbi:MAG: hypothetical protein KC731_14635 [Myxococcales bacterium]|nr:hypothetical protein [Myxococcales bacterium]
MLVADPHLQDWQADVGARLRAAVETVYAAKPDEVKAVEALVKQVQDTKPLSIPSNNTRVSVEGAMLHGSRSQV